jgi:hypothetical protein
VKVVFPPPGKSMNLNLKQEVELFLSVICVVYPPEFIENESEIRGGDTHFIDYKQNS